MQSNSISKIFSQVEAKGESTKASLQATEAVLIQSTNLHSHRDETDKLKLIDLLKDLDALTESKLNTNAFTSNERLQKGYEQLQAAQAAVVFEKGLGRLAQVREEIWKQV